MQQFSQVSAKLTSTLKRWKKDQQDQLIHQQKVIIHESKQSKAKT